MPFPPARKVFHFQARNGRLLHIKVNLFLLFSVNAAHTLLFPPMYFHPYDKQHQLSDYGKWNFPRLLLNDNVRIAKDMDADGVHVGQSDMEADDVRKILGEDKILGVSAQTVEQAVLAEKMGADYLGVGAVFSTSTKKDAADAFLLLLSFPLTTEKLFQHFFCSVF